MRKPAPTWEKETRGYRQAVKICPCEPDTISTEQQRCNGDENVLRTDEAGISIVEILIATFILFFVITAVMGLLTMSFVMSTGARRQSSATAMANRQIESIRALPYASIGVSGGDPNGTLAASETTTSAGIVYTITRSITWVDDVADNSPETPGGADSNRNDYKDVRVTLSWLNPTTGTTAQVSVSTSIREPWVDTNAPTVDFTANNVPSNSIVYENKIYNPSDPGNPGELYVQGEANDNLDADGIIASLIFYVDGRVLRNPGYTPSTASWAPNAQTFTNTIYPVNTLAVDESGTAIYPDGLRELKVEAWDNSGARDFKIINMTVDNYAPAVPGSIDASVSSANGTCFNQIGMAWTGAMDGTDWADHYSMERNKNGTIDTSLTLAGTASSYTDTPLTPFSRYTYRIRSVSPMQRTSAYTALTASLMTRPKLTGTANGNGGTRTATLTWTPPTFSATSVHYHIYQATSWSGSNLTSEVSATTGHTYTATSWTSPSFNKTNQYYWQVRTSLYIGGTHYSVYSNVIGPSPLSGSYPIPP